MAAFKDYHKTLGLTQAYSQLEIKAKCRAIAHHPDKNSNDPEAITIFQLIVDAYEKLSDASSR